MSPWLRDLAQRPRLQSLARRTAHRIWTLGHSLDTPRDALLSISELARRGGGDRLGVADTAPLTPFELRAFSQNGEDGVLQELLRRAGEGGRFFVEFGAGNGQQNNCSCLADVFGWAGLFMEGDPARAKLLASKYHGTPVATRHALVTADELDDLLEAAGAPAEPDVLSIDVDGPDYAIWHGLKRHTPRVVVIEYDGSRGPLEHHIGPSGASIAALRALGTAKGYSLVHTELTGNNAFFVRSDQPGTYPPVHRVPLRSANHYLAGEGYVQRDQGTLTPA